CPTSEYTEITKKKISCDNGTWNTIADDICLYNACSTDVINTYKSSNLPELANITIGATDIIENGADKTYTCDVNYEGSIVLSCSDGNITGYTGSCSPTCTGLSLASKISNASQTSWYTCPTNNVSCTSGGTVSVAATIYAQNTYAYLNACNTTYMKSATAIYKCTGLNTWTEDTYGYCVGQVKDQYLESGSNGATRSDAWQAFTPSMNGYLSQVDVYGMLSYSQTFYVYEGEGTSGTLLHTQSISFAGGNTWRSIVLSTPIHVTNGSKYTFRIIAGTASDGWHSNWYYYGSIYSGGSSSIQDGFQFRTYTVPSPPAE
ncbi:MAG: hypothetical protein PHY80_00605, partial [Rickettsiales bacterium]|nr:hypothetical protein [Rickettsiales bacterium]